MIIEKDSPLRRFPATSENKQTLFFDGIRYSIEMAALAYTRLKNTLLGFTMQCTNSASTALDFTPAILDAWSIIDAIHRLRILINQTPGMKKKTSGFQLFERRTSAIKDLRDFVQHLDEKTQELIGQDIPVWGALSWFTMADAKANSGFTCTLVAGTIFQSMENLLINPLGKKFEPPIDLITLTAFNQTICLSEMIRHVTEFKHQLEEGLKDAVKDLEPAQADILACAEMQFNS